MSRARAASRRMPFRLVLLVMLGALTAALLVGRSGGKPEPAAAAGFVVATTADFPNINPAGTTCVSTAPGGACTLRAAITAANNTGGANTITLPTGVFPITRNTAGEDLNDQGDFDVFNNSLAPTYSLTITGAGNTITVINAALHDRVFDVLGSASLTLQNLALVNGSVTGDGGCIRSAGPALTLTSVIVQ